MSDDFWKDRDDYHAFVSTRSDSEGTSTSGDGSGCSSGCLSWIVAIIGILWFIGKLFG